MHSAEWILEKSFTRSLHVVLCTLARGDDLHVQLWWRSMLNAQLCTSSKPGGRPAVMHKFNRQDGARC